MMKNYATLAIGMSFCLAASAAPVRDFSSYQNRLQTATAVGQMVKEEAPNHKVAKAPAKVSSVEDFYGDYEWVYYNAFSDESGYGGWQTSYLNFDASDKENTVVVSGYSGCVWEATVDVQAGTVSFKKQFSMEVESETGRTGDVYLTPYRWADDGKSFHEVDEVVGVLEDGVIMFDDYDMLGLPSPFEANVFYGPLLGYAMTMTYKPVVTINLDEWEVLSEPATLLEGWFSPVFTEDGSSIEYNVQIGVNKHNPNRVIIINPYNNEIWAGVNGSEVGGYIEVDFENPDLVMCQTRLYSGLAIEFYEEGVYDQMYCYNFEGLLYYINGVPQDEIESRLFNQGYEISYKDGNEVNIYNTCFGTQSDKNAGNAWKNAANYSLLTLPKAYDDYVAGVESIEFDENAPVKYYNFQGVEVANPAKGQLVIKTQGSKAQKMIIR